MPWHPSPGRRRVQAGNPACCRALKAPEDWRTPGRFANCRGFWSARQRLGLRWPSTAFPSAVRRDSFVVFSPRPNSSSVRSGILPASTTRPSAWVSKIPRDNQNNAYRGGSGVTMQLCRNVKSARHPSNNKNQSPHPSHVGVTLAPDGLWRVFTPLTVWIYPKTRQTQARRPNPHFLQFVAVVLVSVLVLRVIPAIFRRQSPQPK